MIKKQLTAELERILVERAKKGDIAARNYLYEALHEKFRKVHETSAMGTHPKKWGYMYNVNGKTFEEACGDLFMDAFIPALRTFDETEIDLNKFKHTTPFPSYVKYRIQNNAKTECKKAKDAAKRYSEVLRDPLFQKVGTFDYTGPCDNAKLDSLINKVRGDLSDEEKKKYINLYLDSYDNVKNVIPAVTKELGKVRTDAYHIHRCIKKELPPEVLELFHDIAA